MQSRTLLAARATLPLALAAALSACGGGAGSAMPTAVASAGTPPASTDIPATPASPGPGGTSSSGTGAVAAVQLQHCDFTVNTSTAGDQGHAQIARLADGGWVVVWTSMLGGPATDVRLQRYDAQGQAAGSETVVAASGSAPGVVARPDGGFTVTWTDSPFAGEVRGYAQAYDAQGRTRGAPQQLAAAMFSYVLRPLGLADGTLVAAVDTLEGKYGAGYGLVTRYAPDGSMLGTPTRLDSGLAPPTGGYDRNRVNGTTATSLAGAGFAVAWVASGIDDSELRLTFFDAQARQQGTHRVVMRDPQLRAPGIATLADGSLVLAWQAGQAPAGRTAWLERFDPGGRSLGRQVLASDGSADDLQPRVAALADGCFVAAWTATRYGTSTATSTTARRFARDGTPLGVQAIGSTTVPTGSLGTADSLALAPAGGGMYWVLHGGSDAGGGWDVRASVR